CCCADPGSFQTPASGTIPGLQRTASRCAAPGKSSDSVDLNVSHITRTPPVFGYRLLLLHKGADTVAFKQREAGDGVLLFHPVYVGFFILGVLGTLVRVLQRREARLQAEHERASEIDKLRRVRFGAYAFFLAVVIWFGHRPHDGEPVAMAPLLIMAGLFI